MPINRVNEVYRSEIMVELTTNGTAAVDVLAIQASSIVEKVVARIKTAAVRAAGACNVIAGDDDDDDGFIASSDAKAAAGTVYGDAVAETGAYLKETVTDSGSNTHDQPKPAGKVYTVDGKKLKVKLSAAPDSEATLQMFITTRKFDL